MFKIENSDSLNRINKKIGHIKNKVVVARFKMEGCIHCINSQPIWNKMVNDVKQQYILGQETMFVEIDSNIADSFVQQHRIKTEHNQMYAVHGFPEHVMIVKGVAFKSNSGDVKSTLEQILHKLTIHKHVFDKNKKSKTRKSKTRRSKSHRSKLY
jgi:hypothetical protein